jgi:hypothetical protein
MGPCDVPLDTIFDDPAENLVYQMTKAEFAAHLRQLENYLFAEHFDQVNQAIEENEDLSLTDKQAAKQLLERLKKKIFKPTIGLNEFVSGFTPLSTEAAQLLPEEILHQLLTAFNPMQALESIVSGAVFQGLMAL